MHLRAGRADFIDEVGDESHFSFCEHVMVLTDVGWPIGMDQ